MVNGLRGHFCSKINAAKSSHFRCKIIRPKRRVLLYCKILPGICLSSRNFVPGARFRNVTTIYMGKPATSTLEMEKVVSPERNLEWLVLLYHKKAYYADRNMVLFQLADHSDAHSSTPNTPQGRTNFADARPSVGRRDKSAFSRATGVGNASHSPIDASPSRNPACRKAQLTQSVYSG